MANTASQDVASDSTSSGMGSGNGSGSGSGSSSGTGSSGNSSSNSNKSFTNTASCSSSSDSGGMASLIGAMAIQPRAAEAGGAAVGAAAGPSGSKSNTSSPKTPKMSPKSPNDTFISEGAGSSVASTWWSSSSFKKDASSSSFKKDGSSSSFKKDASSGSFKKRVISAAASAVESMGSFSRRDKRTPSYEAHAGADPGRVDDPMGPSAGGKQILPTAPPVEPSACQHVLAHMHSAPPNAKSVADQPNAALATSASSDGMSVDREQSRPSRPMAVLYSPLSELPRKVKTPGGQAPSALTASYFSGAPCSGAVGTPSAGASTATAAAEGLPMAKRGPYRGKVRRIGWDVQGTDAAEVLAVISRALADLNIPCENMGSEGDAQSIRGLLTLPTCIEASLGAGVMRAAITVTPTTRDGSAVPAGQTAPAGTHDSPVPFRIDVTRHQGDTFQFHAFYRGLEEALRPLIGEGKHAAGRRPFVAEDWSAKPSFMRSSAAAAAVSGMSNAFSSWTRR